MNGCIEAATLPHERDRIARARRAFVGFKVAKRSLSPGGRRVFYLRGKQKLPA